MWRRIATIALGLGLPIAVFLIPLQVLAHASAELRVDKVDAATADARAAPARTLSPQELDALPQSVRDAFAQAIAHGSASLRVDPPVARALAELHLSSGLRVVLDGTVLVLRLIEHAVTVGAWVADRAESAACWMAAHTGGGCASA